MRFYFILCLSGHRGHQNELRTGKWQMSYCVSKSSTEFDVILCELSQHVTVSKTSYFPEDSPFPSLRNSETLLDVNQKRI